MFVWFYTNFLCDLHQFLWFVTGCYISCLGEGSSHLGCWDQQHQLWTSTVRVREIEAFLIYGLEGSSFQLREIRNWSKDDVLSYIAHRRGKTSLYISRTFLRQAFAHRLRTIFTAHNPPPLWTRIASQILSPILYSYWLAHSDIMKNFVNSKLYCIL
jgi:hypothetical protein